MPKAAEPKAKAIKEAKEKKEPKDKGIGQRKSETLAAMKKLGGKNLTHAQIAEVTDKPKGNQLRELTELGLVDTQVHEGKREHVFSLTAEGRKVAAKL